MLCIVVVGSSGSLHAQRTIELTLLGDSKSSSLDHQQWMQAMSAVGADRVRIQTTVRPKPKITEEQTGGYTIVRVNGVISGGRIKFPGKSFARSDSSGITTFLSKLRDDGMKTTLATKKAFGLTSEQLVSVHQHLAASIDSQTEGMNSASLVDQILEALPLRHETSQAAKARLADSSDVTVEGSTGECFPQIVSAYSSAGQPSAPHERTRCDRTSFGFTVRG
jgi:hypothetical protein